MWDDNWSRRGVPVRRYREVVAHIAPYHAHRRINSQLVSLFALMVLFLCLSHLLRVGVSEILPYRTSLPQHPKSCLLPPTALHPADLVSSRDRRRRPCQPGEVVDHPALTVTDPGRGC